MTLKDFYTACKEHKGFMESTFNKTNGVYTFKVTVHHQVKVTQVSAHELFSNGADYLDKVIEGLIKDI
ncbi:hypothetical protein [uncultured Duncaniella sp.]|uniref:hypothetical protein n=1 Tax=uncultured Duncaniella sp. TaxID=2768039 RepID=UPI0026339FFD|nr:hypothetical protein [uncultured Duncaniella sp.]